MDAPTKFVMPFGASAGAGFIRPIPVNSQIGIVNGAASLTDGFPPLNFLPVGSGGVPPFGQDFNGILNQVTAWAQWQAAGGPIYYDSQFATAVGGYPVGALLQSATTPGLQWVNLSAGNTSDPDAGGTNWLAVGARSTVSYFGNDTGAANAYVVGYSPALTAHIPGLVLWVQIKSGNTNTGGAATFNPGPGAKPIKMQNGANPPAGFIQGAAPSALRYDGTNYVLVYPESVIIGDVNSWRQMYINGWIMQGAQLTENTNTNGTITFSAQANNIAFPSECVSSQVYNRSGSATDAQKFMSNGVATATTLGWWCTKYDGTPLAPNAFSYFAMGF